MITLSDMHGGRLLSDMGSGAYVRAGGAPAEPLPAAVPVAAAGTRLGDDGLARARRRQTTRC